MLLHMVIWITGLSGAGKTSIGRALLDLWRQDNPAVVLVDGDDHAVIRRRFTVDDMMKLESMPPWLEQNPGFVADGGG